MHIFKSNRGETMVEVLIALMVLVIGAVGALRLLGIAGINNQITKERVEATNLAREGIEAVRNIRDTNWLRFAGERRICWNNLDYSACNDVDDDGIADLPIRNNQQYIAIYNPNTFRWELSNDGLGGRLDIGDGEIFNDDDYRLKEDSITGLLGYSAGEDSIYYREIYTEYLDADQTPAIDEDANILRVTSRVQWIDRGKLGEVTLTTILTDYLGRKNHL
jgi:type II secretory pathway pseudopilin PulG